MKPALQLTRVSQRYGDHQILNDITFQVEQGEFFIVIGPNGSGKTSLLKTAGGIVRPAQGRIQVLQRDLAGYSRKALARRLALVPQHPVINNSLTVKETVAMGRAPHLGFLSFESGKDLEIVCRSMEATKIEDLADRSMNQLSGGEQQRVMIARALCQEPEIMLLDEPTSSLDLAHQRLIMDLLEELKKSSQITIVMVAHDLNLASLYGDRLLLLNKGRIARIGTPSQVLTYENLEEVFQSVLLVDTSSLDGLPRVTITPGRYLSRERSKVSGSNGSRGGQ